MPRLPHSHHARDTGRSLSPSRVENVAYFAHASKMTSPHHGFIQYPRNVQGSHIRRDRVPAGEPVVIWASGIPFCPVFGGWYALTGGVSNVWFVRRNPPQRDRHRQDL